MSRRRPARIEYEIGAGFRNAGRECLLDDAALTHRWEPIGGLPARGIMLGAHVVKAALERLEMGVGFAIIVEPDLVEVPEAAIDRKIASPIVGIALEGDAFARIDLADQIGTAAERRLKRGVLECLWGRLRAWQAPASGRG